MNGLRKKSEKPPFWAKMANFWKILAKMGAWNIQALTNCKVSEKSNERFSSNRVTYGRMHVRTDGCESLGLQRLRRETKKLTFDLSGEML